MKIENTDKDIGVVLSLVRKAIDAKADILMPENVNWQRVMGYAACQGVLAMCFDALEYLETEQRPPKDIFFKWMGMSIAHIRRYETIKRLM